jgi:DNA-binding beta-propeller fold protein YncE
MKKKALVKFGVFCCALFLLIFYGASAVLAGQFTFVKKWGFICPALFGCPPTAPAGFWGSSSIAVTPAGTIYVFDLLNARIQKFDTEGNFQGLLTSCPDTNPQVENYCTGQGEVNYSPSIAVSPAGDYLYVSDPRNYRIHKFAANGTWVLSWGIFENIPQAFREPSGIAVDAAGNVYATDILDSKILKFNANGLLLSMWSHPYKSGDDFRPTGIFAAGSGVYVTDYKNSTLYQFDYNGTIVTSWGGVDGTAAGEFTYPADVTVDAADNIFVADTLNNRIQALSGTSWTAYDQGVTEGKLNRPFGIATDATGGTVYVADTFNNRVLKYTYTP